MNMYLHITLLALCAFLQETVADDNAFNLTVQFSNVDETSQHFFTEAADRWSSVITGDLPDVRIPHLYRLLIRNNICQKNPNRWPKNYDDLFLCAAHKSIDGNGTLVGQGGPIFARRGNKGLPFAGLMMFDIADVPYMVDKGIYKNVILHEMGHVLGIGTKWRAFNLVGPRWANPPCPYKLDTHASREFQAISGCSSAVPTETNYRGSPATQCGHWQESCLQGELMTGVATGNLALSRITVGTLEDLSYNVSYAAADPFTVNDLNPNCTCSGGRRMRARSLQQETSRLSDDVWQKAMDYGRSVLSSNRKYRPLLKKLQSSTTRYEYLGDKYVSVFVREGDDVFSVDVTDDDA